MEHLCPICKSQLTSEQYKKESVDYTCDSDLDSHFFVIRKDIQGNLMKLKTRLLDDGVKLYLKVNYDHNNLEVWTGTSNHRVSVAQTLHPDFSDLPKLKSKIRTYLMFS